MDIRWNGAGSDSPRSARATPKRHVYHLWRRRRACSFITAERRRCCSTSATECLVRSLSILHSRCPPTSTTFWCKASGTRNKLAVRKCQATTKRCRTSRRMKLYSTASPFNTASTRSLRKLDKESGFSSLMRARAYRVHFTLSEECSPRCILMRTRTMLSRVFPFIPLRQGKASFSTRLCSSRANIR